MCESKNVLYTSEFKIKKCIAKISYLGIKEFNPKISGFYVIYKKFSAILIAMARHSDDLMTIKIWELLMTELHEKINFFQAIPGPSLHIQFEEEILRFCEI